MTDFVFLGPSLPLADAQKLHADAVFLPPARMGDLYLTIEGRARPGDRIALIDGFFEQVPAVWHKEVLHALARGYPVYGASSMGALRAAELHPFGMIGIGRIFEAYRDGRIERDDEVAVAHADGEHGWRSLSVALASIRLALADLTARGVLPAAMADALLAGAAAQPFGQRHWHDVIAAARTAGAGADALAALAAQLAVPDAKAIDAMTLLSHLSATAAVPAPPPAVDFVFHHTSFWMNLTRELAPRLRALRGGPDAAAAAGERAMAAAMVRAGGQDRDALLEQALLDRIALDLVGDPPDDPDQRRAAAARLAQRFGLADPARFARWRREQGVSEQDWVELVRAELRRQALIARYGAELDALLPGRLMLSRGLAEALARARAAAGRIAAAAVARPSLADLGLDADALQRWYVARFGAMAPDPTRHAESLGFAGLRAFVDALTANLVAEAEAEARAEAADRQEQVG